MAAVRLQLAGAPVERTGHHQHPRARSTHDIHVPTWLRPHIESLLLAPHNADTGGSTERRYRRRHRAHAPAAPPSPAPAEFRQSHPRLSLPSRSISPPPQARPPELHLHWSSVGTDFHLHLWSVSAATRYIHLPSVLEPSTVAPIHSTAAERRTPHSSSESTSSPHLQVPHPPIKSTGGRHQPSFADEHHRRRTNLDHRQSAGGAGPTLRRHDRPHRRLLLMPPPNRFPLSPSTPTPKPPPASFGRAVRHHHHEFATTSPLTGTPQPESAPPHFGKLKLLISPHQTYRHHHPELVILIPSCAPYFAATPLLYPSPETDDHHCDRPIPPPPSPPSVQHSIYHHPTCVFVCVGLECWRVDTCCLFAWIDRSDTLEMLWRVRRRK